MITIRKASKRDVQSISRKSLRFLEDKNGRFYQENITKFGIPEEYVRNALSEETLLKAAAAGKATFYVAVEDDEILGFAQTIQKDTYTAELDRIVIFPPHESRGIGTHLLKQVVGNLKQKGFKVVTVNAGKDETHARRFYEKNGFRFLKEMTIEAPWGRKLDLATYELQLGSS